jgi:hypothetical protein
VRSFLYIPSVQSPFHWLLPSVLVMAPVYSHIQSHEREQEKAAELLQDARDRAFKTRGYNFIDTRKKLVAEFRARNDNKEPYEWQLDVSEALILGLDCTVIAGTGAGKTMPFAMPLYVETEKMMIVISPLNALEEDQVRCNMCFNIVIFMHPICRRRDLKRWVCRRLQSTGRHTMRSYTR